MESQETMTLLKEISDRYQMASVQALVLENELITRSLKDIPRLIKLVLEAYSDAQAS